MPPGVTRAREPHPVVERHTVEACLAIARRIEEARAEARDAAGAVAAHAVAEAIELELLAILRRPA